MTEATPIYFVLLGAAVILITTSAARFAWRLTAAALVLLGYIDTPVTPRTSRIEEIIDSVLLGAWKWTLLVGFALVALYVLGRAAAIIVPL